MPRYIHYFNPENDLALASGDAHYTPPASARQMARDLQSLPCLWAKAGDWVLLEDPPLGLEPSGRTSAARARRALPPAPIAR